MNVASIHSIPVTSRVNGVPRAGSWVRLLRQHGCRTGVWLFRGRRRDDESREQMLVTLGCVLMDGSFGG